MYHTVIPVSFLRLKEIICQDKKKSGPPGEIPPRGPGTTPSRWVGSCQVIIQLDLESVLEFIEDSVVVVIVIGMVIVTIVVVIELPGQIITIVSLVPIR